MGKLRRRIAPALGVGWSILCAASMPAIAQVAVGRGYEQVSPAGKGGYQVGHNIDPNSEVGVSSGGDTVSYISVYPIAPSSSGSLAGFLAQRLLDGWSTSSLLGVPGPNQIGIGFPSNDATLRGTTPDQRTAVYFDNTTEPRGSLWIRRADGTRQRIATASTTTFGSVFGDAPGEPWFEGISADGRHVVFADTDALLPGITPSGSEILYEWVDDGSAGTLHVVNRTNAPSLTLIDPSDAELGGSGHHLVPDVGVSNRRHAISADGSRIFFQNPAPAVDALGRSLGGGDLYVRVDGSTTVRVSAPATDHAPVSAPTLIQYLDAPLDGRVVFFWANGDLTSDAPLEGGIYEYDVDAGTLAFLAPAPMVDGTPPTGMASDDGSHLYFQDGSDVSVYADGTVSTVLTHATVEGGAFEFGHIHATIGMRDDVCASANVSSDGRYFVFTANATGDVRVYRYDASSGVAAQDISAAKTAPNRYDAGFSGAGACITPLSYPRQFSTRIMSADAGYVFFDTSAPLVPEDNNGQVDAYQWHDGTVSLISSGTSGDPSTFSGTDVDGRNAFLITTDALVPQDGDAVYDIYDARIGGGFFAPAPVAPCEGNACQGAPSAPPPASSLPASATLRSRGNVRASPAATFAVERVSAAARRRFARTGRFALGVRVTAPGTVTARLLVRLGHRWVQVDARRRSLRHRGRVRLGVDLSRGARDALRHDRRLPVRITVSFSRAARAKRLAFSLHAPVRGRR